MVVQKRVKWQDVVPDKTMQNCFGESFHERMWDELRNMSGFRSLAHAFALVAA